MGFVLSRRIVGPDLAPRALAEAPYAECGSVCAPIRRSSDRTSQSHSEDPMKNKRGSGENCQNTQAFRRISCAWINFACIRRMVRQHRRRMFAISPSNMTRAACSPPRLCCSPPATSAMRRTTPPPSQWQRSTHELPGTTDSGGSGMPASGGSSTGGLARNWGGDGMGGKSRSVAMPSGS